MTEAAPNPSPKILLVEDSGLQAQAIVRIFQELGFKDVTACPHADFAYAKLTQQSYDIIFCDWNMPRKSGLEFVREVRDNEALKDIPFVFLTAQSDKKSVVQALMNGAQDYIVKPATSQVIAEKMRKLAGN